MPNRRTVLTAVSFLKDMLQNRNFSSFETVVLQSRNMGHLFILETYAMLRTYEAIFC